LTHNENDLNNNSAVSATWNDFINNAHYIYFVARLSSNNLVKILYKKKYCIPVKHQLLIKIQSKNADNIAGKTSTGAAVLQTKVDAIRLMLNNATGVDRSIYGKLEEIVDEGRHQFEELIALRNRMKSLTTSLRSYRDESHQKEVEIQQLTQTFDRFKVEHERLKSTNRDQNAVIESLHSKLVELTTTTATTTAPAMQISNDELEQLQDELSNLRLTITEKERLIERFAEDYVPLRRFEQVREDNRLLETDLEECYALIEEMKVTIEQHQEVNGANADEELESRLLSLEAHNERLLGEIMRKDDKILELTDALREALDENKQVSCELICARQFYITNNSCLSNAN
jgi:chromosome segregation ATPase